MIIEKLHEEYICRANIPRFNGSKNNPLKVGEKMVNVSKKQMKLEDLIKILKIQLWQLQREPKSEGKKL